MIADNNCFVNYNVRYAGRKSDSQSHFRDTLHNVDGKTLLNMIPTRDSLARELKLGIVRLTPTSTLLRMQIG